jgi:hypothetical protein
MTTVTSTLVVEVRPHGRGEGLGHIKALEHDERVRAETVTAARPEAPDQTHAAGVENLSLTIEEIVARTSD